MKLTDDDLRTLEQSFKKRQLSKSLKQSNDKRGSINIQYFTQQSTYQEHDSTLALLVTYFKNIEDNIEAIQDFFRKKNIYYPLQLRYIMPPEDYKAFLQNTELYRLPEGTKLQEQGRFHPYHYILLEGNLIALRQRKLHDQERQFIECFQFQNGEPLFSNTLQTHKANPYTVKAKRQTLLLRFTQDTFSRYLKKIYIKEQDELSSMLCHSVLFRGVPIAEMKKYLPYCPVRRYGYNEIVYREGELIRQLFFILQGEAEIGYKYEENKQKNKPKGIVSTPVLYKQNYTLNDKKEVKIVKLGKKQFFGLESPDIYNQNYYQHNIRVTSNTLTTLTIGLDVLYDLQNQNPILEQNMSAYLKKVSTVHVDMLQKYNKVAQDGEPKKKKKKKKLRRKQKISFQWWGLAQKMQATKKYRLPTPPKNNSQQKITRKQALIVPNRISKLQYFKRRIFEDQMQELQRLQKQNNECTIPKLMPKLQKLKIKMLNPKPKVVNNAERIKKKLLQYAKTNEIFCDKLQLQ